MSTQEIKVPDIGGSAAPVIEVLVQPGDQVDEGQGLVTLESDKATMDIPAPFAGTVREISVKVGDEIGEGAVIALMEAAAGNGGKDTATAPQEGPAVPDRQQERPAPAPAPAEAPRPAAAATPAPGGAPGSGEGGLALRAPVGLPSSPPVPFDASTVLPAKVPYASPAVRAIARELGVDLNQVEGSARKGRITTADVRAWVKRALAGGAGAPAAAAGSGPGLLPWPEVDFSRFGEVETTQLSRIQKISGANLARNWAMIPHVTHHDESDVTGLEALRKAVNAEQGKDGTRLTLLAFLVKAVVACLQKFPQFNASLDAGGENLVLKKYFHIGFAADTPNGLVVPVIRDADRKGVLEIAAETAELAARAREGKLGPADMQGGCFTISSLGGIGGTGFTPIVNAPEVAILGVSRSAMKPVWDGKAFQPRLMLPLSLSYDHRVIDGAAAARFTAHLATLLGDLRRALL